MGGGLGGLVGGIAKIASSFIPGLSTVMDMAKMVMDLASKAFKDSEAKFEEARNAVKGAEQKASQARAAGADDLGQVNAFFGSFGINLPGIK